MHQPNQLFYSRSQRAVISPGGQVLLTDVTLTNASRAFPGVTITTAP